MWSRRDFLKMMGLVPAAPTVFSLGSGVWVPPEARVEVVSRDEYEAQLHSLPEDLKKALTAQDLWYQYVRDFNEVMGIRA